MCFNGLYFSVFFSYQIILLILLLLGFFPLGHWARNIPPFHFCFVRWLTHWHSFCCLIQYRYFLQQSQIFWKYFFWSKVWKKCRMLLNCWNKKVTNFLEYFCPVLRKRTKCRNTFLNYNVIYCIEQNIYSCFLLL